MSLDEATLHRYNHYSSSPRPPDFQVEPFADFIFLDPPKSLDLKVDPDYFYFNRYSEHRHPSTDTMASTQSDDMEHFQRLSDQYQPEVTVVDLPNLQTPEVLTNHDRGH
jgi:hypothetical protein